MRNDDLERRKELNDLLSSGKANDAVMLEAVIRTVFHFDESPRDFYPPDLREMLRMHPHFKLILKEGVGDGLD